MCRGDDADMHSERTQFEPQRVREAQQPLFGVITSYSIHYTKLYDTGPRGKGDLPLHAAPPARGRRQLPGEGFCFRRVPLPAAERFSLILQCSQTGYAMITKQYLRLILFDIDGTLITTNGIAKTALSDAIEETIGTPTVARSHDFAGKTDPQIFAEIIRASNLPEELIRNNFV